METPIIGVPILSAGELERLQTGRMTPAEATNYAHARNAENTAHLSRLAGQPAPTVNSQVRIAKKSSPLNGITMADQIYAARKK